MYVVLVAVAVAVRVAVRVAVLVGVRVAVLVGVRVAVLVGVRVTVAVLVGVGVFVASELSSAAQSEDRVVMPFRVMVVEVKVEMPHSQLLPV